MNKIHCMIDLETLATTEDAAITQIGLVFFDEDGPRHGGEHEWVTAPHVQPGRRIDGDTMNWHLMAPERVEQLRRSYSPLADPLSLSLREMADAIKEADPAYIWAKSPTFDLRILYHAMTAGSIEDLPWKFWQERDVRTAFHLLETAGIKPALRKTHRALDDALEQADWVARALRMARDSAPATLTDDDIHHEPLAS